LPRADRTRLLALCAPVELTLSEVLATPREACRHVYFPTTSFVSLLTRVGGAVGLEVGMIGREGMLSAHVALGVVESPLHALVQGAGAAWRIETPQFLRELARSDALREEVHLYVYVVMAQLATSAGCVRFHEIGPRLARWLLMSRDRAEADTFFVTQQFLGYMLGVRRVGVTAAAGAFQRAGLIDYRRGRLTILDRAGLERAACSCYDDDLAVYAARLGRASGIPA
jgi:hypothetical protein